MEVGHGEQEKEQGLGHRGQYRGDEACTGGARAQAARMQRGGGERGRDRKRKQASGAPEPPEQSASAVGCTLTAFGKASTAVG